MMRIEGTKGDRMGTVFESLVICLKTRTFQPQLSSFVPLAGKSQIEKSISEWFRAGCGLR